MVQYFLAVYKSKSGLVLCCFYKELLVESHPVGPDGPVTEIPCGLWSEKQVSMVSLRTRRIGTSITRSACEVSDQRVIRAQGIR